MREVDRVKPTANFIGVSEWKLREMVNKKQVPHFRAGRILLFRKDAVLNWIREQEEANMRKPENDRIGHLVR